MTSPATYFIDAAAQAARALETPLASFLNGMNLGGSNAPGIGINMLEGAVVGTPEQFTLLDQRGLPRAAQISQHIGGSGLGDGTTGFLPEGTVRYGDSPTQAAKDADTALDGTIVSLGNSALPTIEGGWVLGA
jgi:hypothetical protein